jgi:hypothetical protein
MTHSLQGTSILNIKARDGDLGDPRNVLLTIEDDTLGYFTLVQHTHSPTSVISVADLVTSNKSIDREHPDILQNGGIYAFSIKVSTYQHYALYQVLNLFGCIHILSITFNLRIKYVCTNDLCT